MNERAAIGRDQPGSAVHKRGLPFSAPTATRALALQRLVGNRATSRVLARWIRHPDADKKGVMVPDVVAAELERFNPPKNE